MIYFSFSLYGTLDKYTRGMIANMEIIRDRFPTVHVAVYIADDVPISIVDTLKSFTNINIIPTVRKEQTENSFDRFLAIDISDCDIMFVRDADSRIHERDAACIEDFINDPSKLFHIIRDHRYHSDKVMGGTWGIRKTALLEPMAITIETWKARNNSKSYGMDQRFLSHTLYGRLLSVAMIHDRINRHESIEKHTPFRVAIVNHLFIGQTHDYDTDGNEKLIYTA
jgi:hypothetical protein